MGGRRVLEERGRRAEPQREDGEAAQPEGERQRRRADEHILRRHAQHFLRVAVGDDQQVAVEMRGGLRLAGGAGREPEQRHVVPAVLTASNLTGLLRATRSSSAS